jgi:hypothetical protein
MENPSEDAILREEVLASEAQEREQLAATNGDDTQDLAHTECVAESITPESERAPSKPQQTEGKRPEVPARIPLREKTALVLNTLELLPVETVSIHNDRPSRIRRGKKGVRIEPHSKSSLRGVIARCCSFMSVPKDHDVHEITPPDDVIEDIMSLDHYPDSMQLVSSVSETPLILAGGRLLTRPGFDTASGVYLWPEPRLRSIQVPERPSPDEVRDSLDVLEDVVADAPFVDAASKANYFAFWLTPQLRHTIDGRVPALVIDAPQQGTGKGLMTSVISITATGREAPSQSSSSSDDELRKVLTSSLRRGTAVLMLDNITHIVRQPSLAAFLTSSVWADRILGHSRIEEFANQTIVILNGNNVAVGGDLSRRIAWTRLDPGSSRPWEDRQFRHPKLLQYVKEQRPAIVRALLTITRSWYAAGCPAYDVPTIGSFEVWCGTVGNILAHSGIEGFLANRFAVYEKADEEASELTVFLRQWLAVLGSEPVAAREVIARLDPDDLPSMLNQGQTGHGSVVKRLSKMLSRYERRRFDQDNIHVSSVAGNGNTKKWQVRSEVKS